MRYVSSQGLMAGTGSETFGLNHLVIREPEPATSGHFLSASFGTRRMFKASWRNDWEKCEVVTEDFSGLQ